MIKLAVHTIPWWKVQYEIVKSSDLFDWKYFYNGLFITTCHKLKLD